MARPSPKQSRSAAQVALLGALCLTGGLAFFAAGHLQRASRQAQAADTPALLLQQQQQAGGSRRIGSAAGLRDRLMMEQSAAAPPTHSSTAAAAQQQVASTSDASAAAVIDADGNGDDSSALPWRAFAHLGTAAANGTDAHHNATQQQQQPAVAYGVSAFLDMRPPAPRIALIIAAVKSMAMQSDWRCLVRAASQGTGGGGSMTFTAAHSRIVRRSTATNNERWFTHQATTLFCELPAPLVSLQPTRLPPLQVTLVRAAGDAGGGSDGIAPTAWVHVEQPPAADDDQRQGVAVCTPPLHTDAYAATLVGWAELQRLLGASTIHIYPFNPGPFTQPLLKHYQAAGFFELHEWIIPSSIMARRDDAPCLLPMFAPPSRAASLHGGVACSHHQDNLGIAWWGQALAIQDCVYRAMTTRRHRWVVIADFDELLLPRQQPGSGITTWASLISHLTHNGSELPAQQYSFQGVRTCAACALPGAHPAAAAVAAAAVAAGGGCEVPRVGFKHVLWPAVVPGGLRDHVKSIVDPLAVEQAHVHSTLTFHASSAGSRSVTIPREQGVKVHDRVHDVHASPTFATVMLPLLRQHIDDAAAPTAAAAGGGIPLPRQSSAWAAAAGGGSNWTVDTALCRTRLGRQLSAAIDSRLQRMRAQRVLPDAWLTVGGEAANVYGGYTFVRWAPAL